MPQIKTLQTIPSSPRLVDVIVERIDIQFEEGYFEAWAEIKEYRHYFPMPYYFEDDIYDEVQDTARTGKVRLSKEAVNELGQTMNCRYMVEDSHVEWET